VAFLPSMAWAQSNSSSSTPSAPKADTAKDAQSTPPSSPLAIHVGDSDLLIGGFMDMTGVFRSTNTGNGLGTNFSNFPFAATASGPTQTGNMSEARFSAQNSRITLQATSKVGTANLKGYIEADFLGNTAQNLNVTSNSNGLRMRLYWAQYQQGKFEFLAGQSWSMIVPNRNGISPAPGDLFYSQDVDTNYQMGLPWGRVPGFRFVAHATNTVTAGLALENPEQYTGGAVVFPKAFAGNVSEVNTGSGSGNIGSSSPTPNAYPDVIGKIAFDPKTGSLHQHLDAAVLIRGFKTYNPATDASFSQTGVSESVNVVLEPMKNVRVVATNFFSNGGGRYLANTAVPDFIVNPNFGLSLVKAWSGIYGPEVTVHNTLLYGYYSLTRVDQNVGLDTDLTQIGYGVDGSTSANHKVDEITVGLTQTLFRDPKIGGMQVMVQYSNLKRTPFSVPAGAPADAKLNMLYFNVRYLLP
jgi:hypothetical protein